jgi:hypothetical protein
MINALLAGWNAGRGTTGGNGNGHTWTAAAYEDQLSTTGVDNDPIRGSGSTWSDTSGNPGSNRMVSVGCGGSVCVLVRLLLEC